MEQYLRSLVKATKKFVLCEFDIVIQALTSAAKMVNYMNDASSYRPEKLNVMKNDKNKHPSGAKVDYKEEADLQLKKMRQNLEEHLAKSDHVLSENHDLIDKMRSTINKQRAIFASIGMDLNEPNPIVKRMKNSNFEGIEDFISLARTQEISTCETIGIMPADGWEAAFSRARKRNKPSKSMSHISNILLENRSAQPGKFAKKSRQTSCILSENNNVKNPVDTVMTAKAPVINDATGNLSQGNDTSSDRSANVAEPTSGLVIKPKKRLRI